MVALPQKLPWCLMIYTIMSAGSFRPPDKISEVIYQSPQAPRIVDKSSSRLDVNVNIEFTLTHGGTVFDIGGTSTMMNGDEHNDESCAILKMAQQKNNGDNDDEESVSSILAKLVQKNCSGKKGFASMENIFFVSKNSAPLEEEPINDANEKMKVEDILEKKATFSYHERELQSINHHEISTLPVSMSLSSKNEDETTSDFHINSRRKALVEHDVRRNDSTLSGKECRNEVCVCDSNPLLFEDQSISLFSSILTLASSEALLDFTSPQYKAACWIMYDDPLTQWQVSNKPKLNMLQRFILAVMFFSTSNAGCWIKDDEPIVFLTNKSECEWHGVGCENGDNSTITSIVLSYANLDGKIPVELSKLRSLVSLNFRSNALVGTIPPDLGFLSSLKSLVLHSNNIEGNIPPGLFEASNLENLNLSENKLKGTLPYELGNTKGLTQLRLGNNNLSGTIPDSLWKLPLLDKAWLGGNSFNSTLSASVGKSKNLRYLWVENNSLEGQIPTEVGLMSNLKVIDLRGNKLEGEIPSSLSNNYKLETILLQHNKLSGTVPDALCSSTSLKSFETDCRNDYFEAPVSCPCCTKCSDTTVPWKGDCPDSKVEIHFSNLYAYDYKDFSYREISWNLTHYSSDLKGSVLLHGSGSSAKDLNYVTCVAVSDCLELHVSGSNFDEANIEYNISVDDVKIYNGTHSVILGERPLSSSNSFDVFDGKIAYQENIKFGYNKINGRLERDSCDDVDNICGKKVVKDSNFITVHSIYYNAVKLSGRTLVDDEDKPQYDVTCQLVNEGNYDSDTFEQHYIMFLLNNVYEIHDEKTEDTNHCDWDVIKCDQKFRVTSINIAGKRLDAEIMQELGHLPYLESLDLSNTWSHGSIPNSFYNLWSLRNINLSDNNLEGTMPNLPEGIQELNLAKNTLRGPISENLDSLLDLETIILQNNKLTQFPVGYAFENIKLKKIDISLNLMKGRLHAISVLEKLEYLDISQNVFTGSLPSDLLHIASISYVNASVNLFWGHIPVPINATASITKTLDISQNQIDGYIPAEIFHMTNLEKMMFQGNKLTGTLPVILTDLHSLRRIRVSHNRLRGKIPIIPEGIKSIEFAHFHGNKFEGEAPKLSAEDYITDCGDPSNVQNPVLCLSCTYCCNKNDECQHNPGVVKFDLITKTLMYMAGLVGFILLMYIMKKLMCSPPRWLADFEIDVVAAIGEESVYILFLTNTRSAWGLAFICSLFQIGILFLFLEAVNIQKEGNDWEYTLECPPYDLKCEDEKVISFYGFVLFYIVMGAWVLKDVVASSKLFVLSIKCRSWDYLFSSVVLFGITFLIIWTSVHYNKAIATTSTELIVNAVILLFVTDLDEKLFELAFLMNPDWVNKMVAEAHHTTNERAGKGMLSTLRHKTRTSIATGALRLRNTQSSNLDLARTTSETWSAKVIVAS